MNNEELVIIGNGFDLKCGLNTKYIDFWKYQRKNNESFNQFICYLEANSLSNFNDIKLEEIPISLEKGISFLDVFFSLTDWVNGVLGSDKTWSGIEDMLLIGFIFSRNQIVLNFEYIIDCFREINNFKYNRNIYIDQFAHLIAAKYLKLVFGEQNVSTRELHDYILSELDVFSHNFSIYISNQITEHLDYSSNAQLLINKITGDQFTDCNIVSFNYTEPVKTSTLANIHGLASKKKIVFGITSGLTDNAKKQTHNEWYYKATKEYKIAKVQSNNIRISINNNSIKNIFIYGLSLGEQDYDFFENLFNKYECLKADPKAKIVFCFSKYGNKSFDDVSEEIVNKVTNLLNIYGDSHNEFGLFRRLTQNGYLIFKFID